VNQYDYNNLTDVQLGSKVARRVMGWKKTLFAQSPALDHASFYWEDRSKGRPTLDWGLPFNMWRPAKLVVQERRIVLRLNELGFDVIQSCSVDSQPTARVGRNPHRAPLIVAPTPGRALMIAALLALDEEEEMDKD
jgi:hypothetical protein